MVQLLSMVWRKILRKRWVLGIVFGLSLIYFLTSTFKQEEKTIRDRTLLQTRDQEQNIHWKIQFNLGNSSRPGNQCRNSVQGKLLITDDVMYVNGKNCLRMDAAISMWPVLGNITVRAVYPTDAAVCTSTACLAAYSPIRVYNMKIPTGIQSPSSAMEKTLQNFYPCD